MDIPRLIVDNRKVPLAYDSLYLYALSGGKGHNGISILPGAAAQTGAVGLHICAAAACGINEEIIL